MEDIGVHPWVSGSLWGECTLGCTHRYQDPLGLGAHWVHPWVLESLWGGWALGSFEYWGAPLGSRDPMGWVGIGCTHGCWGSP